MIKASELRIGNYISVNGKQDKVWGLDLDLFDEGNELISVGSHELRAIKSFKEIDLRYIPITEYLIECFGFKSARPKSGIQKAWILDGIRIEMSNSGNFYYKGKSVYYLHKLQNLFYALNDEELIFNCNHKFNSVLIDEIKKTGKGICVKCNQEIIYK